MSKKRSNGEGTISVKTRNGKPYYCGTVTIGYDTQGKQIRKSFGSFKKSVVIDKMNKVKYENRYNILSNSDIRFGELYLEWIDKYKKNEVSNNTMHEYLTTYKLRIKEYTLNNLRVNQITLKDLQYYFNTLQDEFTPKTIKNTYLKINACLEFAVIQGIAIKNYCKGVTLQKVEKKTDKIKVFSREEQNKILQYLNLNDIVDCVIFFTFFTGLRLGEVLGVKWENIKGNMIDIVEQYGRVVQDGLTHEFRKLKTVNGTRTIPLPDKVSVMLSNMSREYDLIFHINGKGLDHKRPQRRITKICKELRIPHRSFHSIRHSYATRLFELGVPIKTVQILMGHSDIATTMNVYTHVMEDSKNEALEKLNTL